MYSLKNLLMARYWFGEPQPLNSLSLWLMFGFFVAMLAAAAVLFLLEQKKKKEDKILARGLKKICSLLCWMGGLGLIILFFRYEAAYFLSRRFWLAIWFAGLVVWIVFVVRFFVARVPQLKTAQAENDRLRRYLP